MSKVSVDINQPSPYIESSSILHTFKRRLTYVFAIKMIKKYADIRNFNSLLEIGTGSGFFMLSCKKNFPRVSLTGIEYDERLLSITRKRAPFANCIQGNAENFDLHPNKYDVIVSFQVIEHLYNPEAMLSQVESHLNAGGIFIVTTPNLDGMGAKIMKEKWHGYREDHVSLKGAKEWEDLITNNGFEVKFSGSTFFTGIPLMNKLPLGLINWFFLVFFGALRWKKGESFVGVFKKK